ncbi:uncharacterized protein LOC116706816 isoform X2 [Etheostoma spectabile]|uniref:uncharacterized protein LOC116706816 isoform X2 n=1 Tax=Etheostoma spectabile TaxID=54343 RepID=UPI0013AF04B7|nr:uncharacterized protein LOC116706816 isoform X2 [Etheostoma spectabile]
MMAQFRWIIMASFLMLLVQFTAAAGKNSYSTVRGGDEVTLPCGNTKDGNDQDQCDSTEWLFTGSGNTVTLFEHGRIHKEAKAKSDRLRVTEKCALVIKKVADEDVGRYICKHFTSGQHGEDTEVFLSVVTMTEQKNNATVTLNCSVSRYHGCYHTVTWLYEGNKTDLKTTQLDCSAIATFITSHLNQKSEKLFKCDVTRAYTGKVHRFTFSPLQSSGTTWTPNEANNTASENNDGRKPEGWWRIIVVSLGLATLITSVVVVNI